MQRILPLLLCYAFSTNATAQECINYDDYLHWVVSIQRDPRLDEDVRGVAIAGDYVYTTINSSGTWSLQVIDISLGVSFVGSVDIPTADQVAANGEHVYITGDSLYVVDVSDPASPRIVGTVKTPGYQRGIALAGSLALVIDTLGLHLIDISDATSPRILGHTEIPGDGYGVATAGTIACVSGDSLWVIDIRDPLQPQITGSVSAPARGGGISLSGDHAYIADHDRYLHVVDVSDPASPQAVGSLWTRAQGVTVLENIAYVANGQGLTTVDVSSPTSPRTLGRVVTPGGFQGTIQIGLAQGRAFLPGGLGGLQMIDIRNPASPPAVGSWYTAEGYARKVLASETNAFLLRQMDDGTSAVDVIGTGNPAEPQLVGSVYTSGKAEDAAVVENMLYLADGSMGLEVIDVSDPTSPQVVGTVDTPGTASGVAIDGIYAYVADGYEGLQVLDISDPELPVIVGFIETPWMYGLHPIKVAVQNGYAYAIGYDFHVIDISDPASPQPLQRISLGSDAVSLDISRDRAFVTTAGQLIVIDISTPSASRIEGQALIPGGAVRDARAAGMYVYVADDIWGLLAYSTRLPNPLLVGSTPWASSPSSLAIGPEHVFVTDAGLMVFQRQCDPSVPVLLQDFSVSRDASEVTVHWRTAHPGQTSEFRVLADQEGQTRELEVNAQDRFSYYAREQLGTNSGEVAYCLSYRGNKGIWLQLAQQTLMLDADSRQTGPRAVLLTPYEIPGGSVELRYCLAERSSVRLELFDVLGRRLQLIERGSRGPGEHRVAWDRLSESGTRVPRGIYLVRLVAGEDAVSQKFALVR